MKLSVNSQRNPLIILSGCPQRTKYKNLYHTLFWNLQKFVVAEADNPVSAMVEGNVHNAYFVHFEYKIKGTRFKCRTCFFEPKILLMRMIQKK
ncbi:MAG TPA: hypothetical protein DCS83_06490 [Prevotella sp.]|jgi:hypothetical protein|nr:hypothetical protein [Prevotella sp.]